MKAGNLKFHDLSLQSCKFPIQFIRLVFIKNSAFHLTPIKDGYYPKYRKQQVLVKIGRKRNPCALCGMQMVWMERRFSKLVEIGSAEK